MRARIFRHTKSTMQSGTGLQGQWTLQFVPAERQENDPLMGWWGSGDTLQQVSLHFPSMETAVEYATRHAIPHDLEHPEPKRGQAKVYADNFRFGRRENWTH